MLTFAGWRLDPEAKTLADISGREARLTRGEFALLTALAGRPGHVLSRDELLDAVAGRKAAPFDRTIDVLVGRLRAKIETDPASPRIVITVPGFGYKLATAPAVPAHGSGRSADLVAMPDRRFGVLVLPMIACEPDPARECRAALLTEDLIADLAQLSGARIALGCDADRRALRKLGLRHVGRQARCRYIVGGSLRHLGGSVRVSAHLADAAEGIHLATERIDTDPERLRLDWDVIVARLAVSLRRQIGIAEGTRTDIVRLQDPDALIARAQAIWLRGHSREAMLATIRLNEAALALDGNSVDAMVMAGGVRAYLVAHRWSADQQQDEARAASLLRRVRREQPDHYEALVYSGMLLRWMGCLEESVRVLRRARAVHPSDPLAMLHLGTTLNFAGCPEEALPLNHRAQEIDRSSAFDALYWFANGANYQLLDKPREAIEHLLQARAANPGVAFVELRLAAAYGQLGEIDEARQALRAAQADGDFATIGALSDVPQSRHPAFRVRAERTIYSGLRAAGLAG